MVNSRAAIFFEKGKLKNLIIEVDVQHGYTPKQKMAFVSKSYSHILHSMVYNEGALEMQQKHSKQAPNSPERR